MAGRYINDGTISGRKINARISASQRYYTCVHTGRKYVSIIALCPIHPGEEIFIEYGPLVKWKNLNTTITSTSPPNDPDSDTDDTEDNDDQSDTTSSSPDTMNSGSFSENTSRDSEEDGTPPSGSNGSGKNGTGNDNTTYHYPQQQLGHGHPQTSAISPCTNCSYTVRQIMVRRTN